MMTHDEIIAVVQAHKDGKKIEIYNPISESWYILNWNDIESIISGISNGTNYRIAPEPPKSQYVPFESMEEFMPHRDKWFKIKNRASVDRIIFYGNDGLFTHGEYRSWKEVFENITFEDDTPCGKLVEK